MKQVMVVPSFHCDVVWRRTPGEQTAIRAAQFSSALNMLAKCPEFRFEFDQAAIVREYLAAHPARLKAMRRFIREGRLDITGGEETIPDTNMVTGEGLVRNFFLGRLWFEETLGVRPVVANLDDAFGLNPQLPQVFRLFGYRYFREAHTPGLDLKLARRGILWEGLDGSRIFYAPAHGHIQLGTHVCNLPIVYAPMERAQVSLAETISVDLPVVYCTYSSEEGLVEDRVVDLVLNWPARRGERIRFALAREALVALRRACPRPPVVRGEFNPSQPGTYITRISLKQAYRRAEWDTIVAESAAACVALAGSAGRRGQLTGMWRKLAYVQFHDSLCGCHTAPVNRRVMDYCRQVSRTAQRLGTEAVRRLHARGGRAPGLVVFNPLPFARREPLEIALPKSMVPSDANGNPVAAERWGRMALAVVDLAPL
ncbi:MAG: hypothetical protein KKD33_06320, partial [Verrucomicrobia bacterium]|nr:hypothetical protein [Verrucomicrobiota bacterium]